MKNPVTLIAGQKYDRGPFILIGWKNAGKSNNPNLSHHAFWSADGTYLGADKNGMEPIYQTSAEDPSAVEAGIRALDPMTSKYALSESRAKMQADMLRRR